jgi:molecular chaperone GrpE
MVLQQIGTTLEQHGCVRIGALGVPFDPNLHEAILQQPSQEYPAGTVIQVVRPGFRLCDRVVRASQVIVAAAPAAEADGDT